MGCENKSMFLIKHAKNYNDLFKGSKIIPVNLLKTVKNKIVNSSELSKGCHII